MNQELNNIRSEFMALLMDLKTAQELEELRIEYLGRSGKLTQLTKTLKDLPSEERRDAGSLLNETKQIIVRELSEKLAQFSNTASTFDTTVPGILPPMGNMHLITQSIEEIADIFTRIGFIRRSYPEVEGDWYAFEALNMPKEHPARDEWETFFVDKPLHNKLGKLVLTPHTSSGQVREMQAQKPPIRMINIAKCYRRQSDVTHVPMFHQFEGLVIDKGITVSHLKGTIEHFAKSFFGASGVSRIRPYNFRFTEPSFEVDFQCVHCNGRGCKFCKSGWHEVGGAGMVHPNVLRAGGLDPNEYTGFAFGWGVERVSLLRPGLGINDLRTLYSTDLRVLTQF